MNSLAKTLLSLGLLVGYLASGLYSQDEFSDDNAYEILRYLSVKIGPRPMGSPAEQAALDFAAEKFTEYGCDSSYVMKITQGKDPRGAGTNTNSGVAVGISNGTSNRIIVIGGHIDSAGPEIPGANDDGSGTAVVLELARVFAKRPHESNLVFAAFGGEEPGLIGSTYFAKNFEEMDKVVLMLQIDMAASNDFLVPLIETKEHIVPKWLVKDSYDIYHSLGFTNINYPTHFITLSNVIHAIGSDHEPFLDKGIPAIDFSTGINDSPIHTPQDSFDKVSKVSLRRSGVLVEELIEKYDAGVPESDEGNYMLIDPFEIPIFVPDHLLTIFVILSLALGIISFLSVRNRRLIIDKEKRIRFSGLKLLACLVIIYIFLFLSEYIVQIIVGLRFPWYTSISKYVVYGVVFSLVGIWLSLELIRKWTITNDTYSYYLKTFVIIVILTVVGFLAGGSRLALYPASALFFISLSSFVRSGWLKLILWILSTIMIVNLIFNDLYFFVLKTSAMLGFPINTLLRSTLYNIAQVLVLVILSIAFVYAFAFVYYDQDKDLLWLKKFGGRKVLVTLVLTNLVFIVYLVKQPAYSATWTQPVRVTQKYDLDEKESKVIIRSCEYLRDIEVQLDSERIAIDQRNPVYELEKDFTADWVSVTETDFTITDEEEQKRYDLDFIVTSTMDLFTLTISFNLDKGPPSDVDTDLAFREGKKEISLRWYSFPENIIRVKISFKAPKEAKLTRTITANYLDQPMQIICRGDKKDFYYRTTVTKKDEFETEEEAESGNS